MPRAWLFILNGAYGALLLSLTAAGAMLYPLMPGLARMATGLPVASPVEELKAVPIGERVIKLPPDTIRGIDFDGGDVYAAALHQRV
jgi:hypothetical protein